MFIALAKLHSTMYSTKRILVHIPTSVVCMLAYEISFLLSTVGLHFLITLSALHLDMATQRIDP